MHIYSVMKEDGGTYVCEAINEVGKAAREVELKILSMNHLSVLAILGELQAGG